MPLESLENGRYQSISELGRGSMGDVYLVNDTVIGRKVAIKVMRADPSIYVDAAMVKDAVRLFKHEAQAIARLEHPHILPLYDFGEEKQQQIVFLYMVMPNCPQGSLASWLQQHRPSGPLPPTEVAYFVEQAAEALQYAHDHHVIHQDVKPSNFLLRTLATDQLLPDLLLADFGVARMSSGTTVSILDAGPCGTPRYMPPEQWEGNPVPASDQYALAIMAYQLLTATFPFKGTQMLQLMYQHLQTAPEPPGKVNPQLSPAIDAVIVRALAKQPEARFSSVKAFAAALHQAVQEPQNLQLAQDNGQQRIMSISSAEAMPTLLISDFSDVQERFPMVLPAHPVLETMPTLLASDFPDVPAPSTPLPRSVLVQPWTPSAVVNYTPYPPSLELAQLARVHSSSRGKLLLFVSLVLLIVLAGAGGVYYTFLRTTHSPPLPVSLHTVNNPYTAGMPTLRYADPLSQPQMWQNRSDDRFTNGSCLFQEGAYHVSSAVAHTFTLCPAGQQPITGDMTFEVQMRILHGDCGGIVFRADFQQGNFYYFDVCFDGRHYLVTYMQNSLLQQFQMQTTPFPTLASNPHASVTVAMVARGSSLTFYLNYQQIDHVSDSTYTSGQLSLFCFSVDQPTEVAFSNARLWTA